MSILIRGMAMPKNCLECLFFESKYHFHGCLAKPESINNINMWDFVGNRPKWCPLIELPPHGRLIDADALKADIQKHADIYANYGHHDLVSMAQRDGLLCAVGEVVNAPTIIEAEGEDDNPE